MKYFYTYCVVLPETKEYYLGSRETAIPIEKDKYMGSMCSWRPDKSKLIKTILGTYNDRKELIENERKIILENIKNPLNRNYHIPSLDANLLKRTSLPFLIETYGEEKGLNRYKEINAKIGKTHEGKPKSKIHRQRISDSEMGKELSVQTKNDISIGLIKAYKEGRKIVPDYSGSKHPMFEKHHSEKSRLQISQSQLGKKRGPYKKKLKV